VGFIYIIAGIVIALLWTGSLIWVRTATATALTSKEVESVWKAARLTKEDAVLYRKAAKILNRLVNVTDLEGDIAADIVSPTTQRQIEVWLIDYKKELDKV
jgi:hypothetical protein